MNPQQYSAGQHKQSSSSPVLPGVLPINRSGRQFTIVPNYLSSLPFRSQCKILLGVLSSYVNHWHHLPFFEAKRRVEERERQETGLDERELDGLPKPEVPD